MPLLRLLVRHRHQRRGRQIRSPVSRPPRSRTVQLSGSPGGRRADRRSSLWMRRLVLFDPRILHPLLGQTCTTIYSMCSVLRASPRSLLRAALAPMRRASTTPARPAAHGTTTAAPTAAPTACGYDERASGYCSEGTDARALAPSPDGAVSTCRHRRLSTWIEAGRESPGAYETAALQASLRCAECWEEAAVQQCIVCEVCDSVVHIRCAWPHHLRCRAPTARQRATAGTMDQ